MIIKDEKISAFASTADEAEISRFNKLAEEWWKPKGAFKVVHAFNAARVKKLSDSLPLLMGQDCKNTQPLSGLTLLDVGCGAGIVSEPIAKLGADITAIDASERNVLIARQHAEKTGVNIDYKHALPEEIASSGKKFDIVTSLEVIEHVADPAIFLNILARLVKPGGILVIGTLNRTPVSFVKAIIGAEYIMRWLPKGTHDWRKFVKPREMDEELIPLGFSVEDSCGV
ncbi:MAG: bifunctional 2-polyprenyl-6-hydroxyphenol methylase/3-demethylubiquinol 3-O-methyltransferase UbiG, partial [Pseudomonadota bacterium]